MLQLTLDVPTSRGKVLVALTCEDDDIGVDMLPAVAAAVSGALSPDGAMWAMIAHTGRGTPRSEAIRVPGAAPSHAQWAVHAICELFVPPRAGAPAPAVASSLVPAAGVLSGEGGHMG